MSSYYLNKNICIVGGPIYSAIYDFRTGKVYRINQTAERILQICNKQTNKRMIIDSLSKEFYLAEESQYDIMKFVRQLQNCEIILSTQSPKNVMPHRTDSMISPNAVGRLWLELTAKCNLKCKHCYAGAGKEVSEPLSLTEWKSVIDQADALRTQTVQLIGGEPFLYRHIRELLTYISQKSFCHVEIFTNGTLVEKSWAEILSDLGIIVKISMYAPTARIHDSITRVHGSFKRTLNAIHFLLQSDVNTNIAYIIMKENQQYVSDFSDFAESLGVNCRFDHVRPSACCASTSDLSCEFPQTKERIFCFSTNHDTFKRNRNWNPCLYDKMCIKTDGDVIPCIFEREIVYGNVREHSLESIYNGPRALSMRSLNLDKVTACKDCEFRYACFDCRALARASTGNLLSKNPRCTYNPYTGNWG